MVNHTLYKNLGIRPPIPATSYILVATPEVQKPGTTGSFRMNKKVQNPATFEPYHYEVEYHYITPFRHNEWGRIHNPSGPAVHLVQDGKTMLEMWALNGKLGREDHTKPSVFSYLDAKLSPYDEGLYTAIFVDQLGREYKNINGWTEGEGFTYYGRDIGVDNIPMEDFKAWVQEEDISWSGDSFQEYDFGSKSDWLLFQLWLDQ